MRLAVRLLLLVVLLCVLGNTAYAYTPDRNLGNFLEVFVSDLGGLLRGEGLIDGWVRIVEFGEPALWALLLVGGPIALKVMPKKTLQKYLRPAPLVPPSIANPADAAKLKALLKGIDKSVSKGTTILRRIKGLFIH